MVMDESYVGYYDQSWTQQTLFFTYRKGLFQPNLGRSALGKGCSYC